MFQVGNPRIRSFGKTLPIIMSLAMGTAAAAPVPHLDTTAVKSARPIDDGGYMVPGFETGHFAKAAEANLRPDKVLPARYDARTLGLVTPVRNQGACGACYAFSSAADLESKIAVDGLGSFDLSEESMKSCNYQGTGCDGGNQYVIMNYLATHGAELESCSPYVDSNLSCSLGCEARFTVLDFSAISGSTVAPTAVIKQYLLDFGPIHTTLFAGSDAQAAWRDQVSNHDGTGALYYAGTDTVNHSVLIVGWDDDVVHAGGTGAWIIKNSWGTTWGGTCGYGSEGGYGYIAYGSANVGMYSSFVKEFMTSDSPSTLLYHDEGGYTSAFGGLGTVLWGMGAFSVPAETRLHRVEFWTSDATVDVDVYIYGTYSGGLLSNLMTSSLNNTFAEPGYHYVEFATPLDLTSGSDFYVAVRFENQTYQYPLTADGDGPASAGKSWYSFNGSSWSSLESYGVDNTIRVRTSNNAALSVVDRGEDEPQGDPVPRSLMVDGAFPNPFNPTTAIRFATAKAGPVQVTMFDAQGRRVRGLANESMAAGPQQVIWDGRDDRGLVAPSGVYFCLIEAGYDARSIKLALMK